MRRLRGIAMRQNASGVWKNAETGAILERAGGSHG